jgi:hypothetical protein|tara:strand:+ start:217 stop:597 length:381 start_codon:yes stop_codon:yes gene_type:complete
MIKILSLLITMLFSGLTYGAESTTENMEGKISTPEVVFAVCVFADGTLIDHKGAESMSACLKTKREVSKKWKLKSQQMDSIEINGITYKIDGEHLSFMCDLVDANVHHYEDGSWEIIEILGKHKSD